MAITFEDLKKVNKDIKTKDIKGKAYAEVQERITAFRKLFPDGFITTNVISSEGGMVIMGASCGYYNEDGSMHVLGTGTAYEKEGSNQINRTSFVENCETSAVGRALGMAGFGIVASLSSADEVANAIYQQNTQTPNTAPQAANTAPSKKGYKCAVCGGLEYDVDLAKASKEKWGKIVCRKCINAKKKEYEAQMAAQQAAPVADPEPVPPMEVPEDVPLPFPL